MGISIQLSTPLCAEPVTTLGWPCPGDPWLGWDRRPPWHPSVFQLPFLLPTKPFFDFNFYPLPPKKKKKITDLTWVQLLCKCSRPDIYPCHHLPPLLLKKSKEKHGTYPRTAPVGPNKSSPAKSQAGAHRYTCKCRAMLCLWAIFSHRGIKWLACQPRCRLSHGKHARKTCRFPFKAYKITCFTSYKYNGLPWSINTFSKLSRFQTLPNSKSLLDSTINNKAATWSLLSTILFKT